MLITRFAPSPTGFLHLGHAYAALMAFDAAQKAGGRFLLRIEDLDIGRCRPEFEKAIFDDLTWLGLTWEKPVRRQAQHFDDYTAAIAKLESRGSGLSLLLHTQGNRSGDFARRLGAT